MNKESEIKREIYVCYIGELMLSALTFTLIFFKLTANINIWAMASLATTNYFLALNLKIIKGVKE